jgi:hypothetical protein
MLSISLKTSGFLCASVLILQHPHFNVVNAVMCCLNFPSGLKELFPSTVSPCGNFLVMKKAIHSQAVPLSWGSLHPKTGVWMGIEPDLLAIMQDNAEGPSELESSLSD